MSSPPRHTEPQPNGRSEPVLVHFEPDLYGALLLLSEEDDVTVADVLRSAARAYLLTRAQDRE